MSEAGIPYTNPKPDQPAEFYYIEAEKAIEHTITFMHDTGRWLSERHTQNNRSILKRLARETDIFNSKTTQSHIMTLKRKKDKANVADPTKMHLQAIYNNFAEANNIEFKTNN